MIYTLNSSTSNTGFNSSDFILTLIGPDTLSELEVEILIGFCSSSSLSSLSFLPLLPFFY